MVLVLSTVSLAAGDVHPSLIGGCLPPWCAVPGVADIPGRAPPAAAAGGRGQPGGGLPPLHRTQPGDQDNLHGHCRALWL